MVTQNWQLDRAFVAGLPTPPLIARVFGPARDTDAASLLHCSFNRVENERGAPVDRVITGPPEVRAKSFRFHPGEAINGLDLETEAFSWYVMGWSDAADIGAASADRAGMMGNFRQPTQRGSNIYALTNSAFRFQTYDINGSLYTNVLNIPPATMNLPRVICGQRYLDGSDWKIRTFNLSGDSTALSGGNAPNPTTLGAAPAIGAWPIAFGTVLGIYTKHFDVVVGFAFPVAHNEAQRNAVADIMRALASQQGVTQLAA